MPGDRWYVWEVRHDPRTGEVRSVRETEHGDAGAFAEALRTASRDLAARQARGEAHPDDSVGGGAKPGPAPAPAPLRARVEERVREGRRRLARELGEDPG